VFCYRELAAALGDDQPFYGVQAQGLDGRHAPQTRIEDMAAHYVRVLREAQPRGPYNLAGWSLGGNIAYEMACQLHEQGEEVGLLALLDAGAVAPDQKATEEDFLAMLLGLFPAGAQLPLEDLRKLPPDEQLQYFVGRAQEAQLVALDGDLATGAQHVFDVFQADVQAIVEHRPRPFAGRVTLLKAAEQALDLAGDSTLGWSSYAAGGIDVHVIPGDHVHMIREPSVQHVAACLRQCLAAADFAADRPARSRD
jgi:thioesterase domain-containing protein